MNNPLALTDPSGYISWGKIFRTAIAIAAAYYTGQWVQGWLISSAGAAGSAFVTMSGGTIFSTYAVGVSGLGYAVAGAAGGFVAGAISTGNANGAMQGALSGGLFGAAGSVGADSSIQRYVAHAAAGCVSAVAGSGRCGSGAAAAVFGKYATNVTEDITNPIAKGIAASVAGGVGSMIAGGKFENGAVTAAYGYLFNYCSSGKCTNAFEQAMYDYWPGYKAGTLLYNQTMGDGSWTGFEVVDAAFVGAGIAGKVLQVLQGVQAGFFEGTTLADRVVGQMKLGDNHAFPVSVDAFAEKYGTVSTILDSRGNPVQMLTIDGTYNGAKGTFEYIKNQASQIYHRFFNPK